MTRQRPLPLTLDNDNRFDRFYRGANHSAVARLRHLAESERGEADWIFLHGPAASGKTHLLQACAQEWSGDKGRSVYIPLGPKAGWRTDALEGLVGVGLYCLDNIEAVAGNVDWERALFALLNRARSEQASVVMASQVALPSLSVDLPDLASRLAWGERLSLVLPDEQALGELLEQRARQLGLSLDDRARVYLLQRLARNPASINLALKRIGEFSLSAHRRITVPLIREALAQGET
jgi:DnaA family protein